MSIYYNCGNGLIETKWANSHNPLDIYICCPGPSLKNVQKDLRGRGRTIIGVNTSYPTIIPDIWIGLDKPECFDRNLWFEPFKKVCRGNYSNVTLHGIELKDFPETYFLSLEKANDVEEIFTRRAHSSKLVWDKSTFTAAINLAIWKGHKVIHFVGCDFGGTADYSYGNTLNSELRKRNQRLYSNQVEQLKKLTQLASKYNVRFISCTPDSPINEFMEYKDLDTALNDSKSFSSYTGSNKIVHACDAGKLIDPRPTIGHVCNWAIMGGVQTHIMEMAKQWKSCKHKVIFLNTKGKDLKCMREFAKRGIDIEFRDNITEDTFKDLNLHGIVFHNVVKEHVDNTNSWLEKVLSLNVYHGKLKGPDCRYNIAVSDYVNKSNSTSYTVIPPFTTFISNYSTDYLSKEYKKNRLTLGRVQSTTLIGGKKYTDEFFDTLKDIADAKAYGLFTVGPFSDPYIKSGPVIPGRAHEYMRHIDIFVIWGDTKETWSLAASEANLMGIPVIARDMDDGLSEQIKKTGGGILVRTTKQLKEAVNYYSDPNNRLRDVSKAAMWLRENMTIESYLKELELPY